MFNQLIDRFACFLLDMQYTAPETDQELYERVMREKQEAIALGRPYYLDSEDWYRCENYLASRK